MANAETIADMERMAAEMRMGLRPLEPIYIVGISRKKTQNDCNRAIICECGDVIGYTHGDPTLTTMGAICGTCASIMRKERDSGK